MPLIWQSTLAVAAPALCRAHRTPHRRLRPSLAGGSTRGATHPFPSAQPQSPSRSLRRPVPLARCSCIQNYNSCTSMDTVLQPNNRQVDIFGSEDVTYCHLLLPRYKATVLLSTLNIEIKEKSSCSLQLPSKVLHTQEQQNQTSNRVLLKGS